MAAKPQWLLQIPSMLVQLRTMEVPIVDRGCCERIFGVGRRRAIEVMHSFGGYQSGNTVLLNRMDLICQLEALESGAEVGRERRRKARLNEKLGDFQRHRAASSIRISVLPVRGAMLPEGVAFDRGQMTVAFAGVEELLSKLYALAQAAAADFEAFRGLVNGGNRPNVSCAQ